MDLTQLRGKIEELAESLSGEQKRILAARLSGLASVFPFSEYEYLLMFLLDKQVIKFEQYEKLRADYVATNRYLDLFGLAPRIFGEIWAHGHIQDLDSRFRKPDKSLDPSYSGEYDLRLDDVKVEIKAARAINTGIRGSLSSKALSKDSTEPFWMNFQQIKPDAAEVFVFIGVWVDSIVYWVLSRAEISESPCLSHQHRGGIEYQIGVTEKNISQERSQERGRGQVLPFDVSSPGADSVAPAQFGCGNESPTSATHDPAFAMIPQCKASVGGWEREHQK